MPASALRSLRKPAESRQNPSSEITSPRFLAKVTRYALQKAASIAGLMLTTEAMIAELPDEKGEMAIPGGGGVGM